MTGSSTSPWLELEAQLWREVGQHLELEESVRRIAAIVHHVVPADAMLVRRLDREPTRLTTIAFGACRPKHAAPPRTVRSECDAEAAHALDAWLKKGRVVLASTHAAAPLARALFPADLEGTAIAGPLVVKGEPVAVLVLFSAQAHGLRSEHLAAVEHMLEPLRVAFENDQRLHDLARVREALEADRQALLTRLDRQDISETVVGAAAGLRSVMERVEQVARTDAPVLILGETGSGKEVIARAIHAGSRRAQGPIVRINCGAIPPELIDSELFGHERGSFTGAVATRKGWFERADGGTLFLDEVAELPLAAQVRLLRVLQDGSLERVGGNQAITVDVRIVTATHRHLESMVAEGRFREDLWYRISVFPIRLPALRERIEDISALAAHFARRAGLRLSGTVLVPSERDIELLRAYPWPGNVRELIAVIERAAILGDGKRLEVAQALGTLGPGVSAGVLRRERGREARGQEGTREAEDAREAEGMREAEGARAFEAPALLRLDAAMKAHIERALEAAHGRIEGPFGAAKLLGINPHTLRARMRKLRIDWAGFRVGSGP